MLTCAIPQMKSMIQDTAAANTADNVFEAADRHCRVFKGLLVNFSKFPPSHKYVVEILKLIKSNNRWNCVFYHENVPDGKIFCVIHRQCRLKVNYPKMIFPNFSFWQRPLNHTSTECQVKSIILAGMTSRRKCVTNCTYALYCIMSSRRNYHSALIYSGETHFLFTSGTQRQIILPL